MVDSDKNPLSLQRLPDLLAHGPIRSFLSSIVNGAKKLFRTDALSIEGSFDNA